MPSAILCKGYLLCIRLAISLLKNYKLQDLHRKLWEGSVQALVSGEVTGGHGTNNEAVRSNSIQEILRRNFHLKYMLLRPPIEELCQT